MLALTTKTEKITFGEKKILGIFTQKIKFNIIGDIPESMIDAYSEMAEIKDVDTDKDAQKRAFKLMKTIIRDMFYIDNNKKKVDKFVDKLGLTATNKIFVFLNEYVNEVRKKKKSNFVFKYSTIL